MRGGARPGRWVALQELARYLVRMLLRTRGRRPASSSLPSIPCRATPERSGLVYQRETSLEGRQAFTAGPDDE